MRKRAVILMLAVVIAVGIMIFCYSRGWLGSGSESNIADLVPRPTANVVGLALDDLSLTRATFRVYLVINNPTPFGTTIQRANYDLYYSQDDRWEYLGSGWANEPIAVVPSGDTPASQTVELANLPALRGLWELFRQRSLEIKALGHLELNLGPASYNVDFERTKELSWPPASSPALPTTPATTIPTTPTTNPPTPSPSTSPKDYESIALRVAEQWTSRLTEQVSDWLATAIVVVVLPEIPLPRLGSIVQEELSGITKEAVQKRTAWTYSKPKNVGGTIYEVLATGQAGNIPVRIEGPLGRTLETRSYELAFPVSLAIDAEAERVNSYELDRSGVRFTGR